MNAAERSHLKYSRRRTIKALAAGISMLSFARIGASGARRESQVAFEPAGYSVDSDSEIIAFIENMPKAELHIHVEGSIEPELAFDIADRNRISLAYDTVDELKRAFDFNSLESFLVAFAEVQSVLQTSQDFYDAAYAYFRKARSQNVIYVELKFDPQAHTRRGVAFETVLDGLNQAQNDAQRELGLSSQLIMCFQRDDSIDSAYAAFQDALPHADKIVGIGLDNFEEPGFPAKFAGLYRDARDAGFKLTAHCDLEVPNSLEHVRGCIYELGVDRLDHGYSVLQSEELTNVCRERRICFTACPTTDWNHPIPLEDPYVQAVTNSVRAMLDSGLLVTLNTDDPGIMGSRYMNEIMIDTQRFLGLSKEELGTLMSNAFESCWIEADRRSAYLTTLNEYLEDPSASMQGASASSRPQVVDERRP